MIYVCAEGSVQLDNNAGQTITATGETAILWLGSPAGLRLTATGGPAYAALFYTGK